MATNPGSDVEWFLKLVTKQQKVLVAALAADAKRDQLHRAIKAMGKPGMVIRSPKPLPETLRIVATWRSDSDPQTSVLKAYDAASRGCLKLPRDIMSAMYPRVRDLWFAHEEMFTEACSLANTGHGVEHLRSLAIHQGILTFARRLLRTHLKPQKKLRRSG